MRKILIATILILGLTTTATYAQDEELPTQSGSEEVQIEIEQTDEEEGNTETLSEELQIQPTQEIGFLTILFAILTPSLLIAVAYMLIKMSNQ